MHDLFEEMQRQAERKSPIHGLDTRAILVFTLVFIVYAALTQNLWKLLLMEVILISLMGIARLKPGYVLKRLSLVFPFGGFLALMQPFIKPGDVAYTFWIFDLTQQGMDLGALLLLRLFVCVSAVILLSSTSTAAELFCALRALRFPGVFIATLDMMIRYLHIFYENLHRMTNAQKCRCFSARRNPAGYRFVLKSIGNTIGSLFMRSYEQGEMVYMSMLSRGYSAGSDYTFRENRRIRGRDASPIVGFCIMVFFLEFVGIGAVAALL